MWNFIQVSPLHSKKRSNILPNFLTQVIFGLTEQQVALLQIYHFVYFIYIYVLPYPFMSGNLTHIITPIPNLSPFIL